MAFPADPENLVGLALPPVLRGEDLDFLRPVITRGLYPRADARDVGDATLMVGTFFGVALATAAFAGLIPLFGNFRDTLIVTSATTFLAALMFLAIVRMPRRQVR